MFRRAWRQIAVRALYLLLLEFGYVYCEAWYIDTKLPLLRDLYKSRSIFGSPLCIYDDSNTNMTVHVANLTSDEYGTKYTPSQTSVRLYFNLQLLNVEVNEKYQKITATVCIWTSWRDCRLMWTPDLSSASEIRLTSQEMDYLNYYIPQFNILQDVEPYVSKRHITQGFLTNSGWSSVQFQLKTTIPCNINVKDYPFDTQECTVSFEPLADINHMNLTIMSSDLSDEFNDPELLSDLSLGLGRYVASDTWLAVLLPAQYRVRNACGKRVLNKYCFTSQLAYRLLLRRRPYYQVTSLMVPAIVLVLISSAVFILPFDKGDKMGLNLSILLSMSMYTQLMYDAMPDTGSLQPLLSVYFKWCIAMVSFSCAFAAINSLIGSLRVKVPKSLQDFTFHYGRHLLLDWSFDSSVQVSQLNEEASAMDNNASIDASEYFPHPSRSTRSEEKPLKRGSRRKVKQHPQDDPSVVRMDGRRGKKVYDSHCVGWATVSALGDRIFSIIHCLASVSIFLGMFWSGYDKWMTFGGRELSHLEWTFICSQARIQNDSNADELCRSAEAHRAK